MPPFYVIDSHDYDSKASLIQVPSNLSLICSKQSTQARRRWFPMGITSDANLIL